jgi:hypothetical protein
MDALKPQDIAIWATGRLFHHVQSIKNEHREATVWMYLDTLIKRYLDMSGLTREQMMQEMEAYGKTQAGKPDMQPEQAYADYEAQLDTLDVLIAALPEDDRTPAVFLTLNRVAPIHCSVLDINLSQMMQHLDKLRQAALEKVRDECAAGIH